VDLFEPGSGSQVHDFSGGVLQSGLFWTVPLDQDALRIGHDGRRAVLHAEDVGVLDSFEFGGPLATPAKLSFHIEWKASERPVSRGDGSTVPAADPGAFLGSIAAADSTGVFSGSELGFSFRSQGAANTADTYAQIGRERNGAFLRL
jgi:hypothetical protein